MGLTPPTHPPAERGPAYDGPLQKVSVVVPVYFNAETLPTLIERLRVVAEQTPRCQLEMVFVDDGSRDTSFAVLQDEAARDPRVRAIRLSRNFGSNGSSASTIDPPLSVWYAGPVLAASITEPGLACSTFGLGLGFAAKAGVGVAVSMTTSVNVAPSAATSDRMLIVVKPFSLSVSPSLEDLCTVFRPAGCDRRAGRNTGAVGGTPLFEPILREG